MRRQVRLTHCICAIYKHNIHLPACVRAFDCIPWPHLANETCSSGNIRPPVFGHVMMTEQVSFAEEGCETQLKAPEKAQKLTLS